jgi:replicative superfamily II helicase
MSEFEFPDDFLPYEEINRIQEEGLQFFSTKLNKNLLVVAPTGMGKTDLGLMGCYRSSQTGNRVLWLSPLKADTKEKFESFKKRGFKVMLDTGDSQSNIKQYAKSDAEIVVLTNERAASILRSISKRSVVIEGNPSGDDEDSEEQKEVDLVVIDEIHNFGSSGRGPTLESFIIELRHLYPDIVIVGLSATIGNPVEIAEWLDADLIRAYDWERPVPLTKRLRMYKDVGNYSANEVARLDELNFILKEHEGSQFIVFCTSRDRTKTLAKKYCKVDKKTKFTADVMLKKGFAFHNASLTAPVREKIEQGFKEGKIRVIFSTPTLAQSVNLPADVSVGFDVHFYSYLKGEAILIDHNQFNQMGGRAGRPGLSDHGYFYSIVSDADFGPVVMRMDETMVCYSWIWSELCDFVNAWFVGGCCDDRASLIEMSKKIYNYQVEPEDKEYVSEKKIDEVLNWLIKFQFLEEAGMDHIKATQKGRLTAWLMISPYTAQHFFEVADTVKNYHKPEHIFAVMLSCEEFLEALTVRYAKDGYLLDVGKQWLHLVQCSKCDTIMSFNDHPKCPQCSNDDPYKFTVYKFDDRMYKAFSMVFREEIEKDVEDPRDRRIKLSPTDMSELKREVNRLLSAACTLLREHADINIIETVALLANSGRLDMRVIELRKVDGIGMTYAARLVNAGILSISELITSDISYLAKVLEASPKIAAKLVHNAEETYKHI